MDVLFAWVARLTLLVLCVVASVWDLKWRKIPNWLVVIGLLLGLLFGCLLQVLRTGSGGDGIGEGIGDGILQGALYISLQGVLYSVAGALAGGVPWLLADVFGRWTSGKRSIGAGDMKFYAMCGAFLGVEGILFSYCVLAVVSVTVLGVLWLCRSVKRKDRIPFAPLIAAAVVITEVVRL